MQFDDACIEENDTQYKPTQSPPPDEDASAEKPAETANMWMLNVDGVIVARGIGKSRLDCVSKNINYLFGWKSEIHPLFLNEGVKWYFAVNKDGWVQPNRRIPELHGDVFLYGLDETDGELVDFDKSMAAVIFERLFKSIFDPFPKEGKKHRVPEEDIHPSTPKRSKSTGDVSSPLVASTVLVIKYKEDPMHADTYYIRVPLVEINKFMQHEPKTNAYEIIKENEYCITDEALDDTLWEREGLGMWWPIIDEPEKMAVSSSGPKIIYMTLHVPSF